VVRVEERASMVAIEVIATTTIVVDDDLVSKNYFVI
jgi:hypothetical protein